MNVVCSKLLPGNETVDISLFLPYKTPIMVLETNTKIIEKI
jgi:hypothetical protein